MQIEIDFTVFQKLTALRESESDSYNAVIRRLLKLAPTEESAALARAIRSYAKNRGHTGLFDAPGTLAAPIPNPLSLIPPGGAWFDGIHFPDGTLFRATYKGATHHASINDGRWVSEEGIVRNSPSQAANAISQTNVNGWKFWHALIPGGPQWKRLDEFKS